MPSDPKPTPTKAPIGANAPLVEIGTRATWRAWLKANHDSVSAIWLVSYKSTTGKPRLDYGDLVDEALCWGWIDSTVRTIDEQRAANYVSQRKKGSIWSRSNKERIVKLQAAGLMQPPGQALIDAALADGSWTQYDVVEDMLIPPDLAAALKKDKIAAANFAAFAPTVKKPLLWLIYSAKKPETRADRVIKVVEQAHENRRQ